jgi:hypothetical protein
VEELRAEDLEELVQELEEEYDTDASLRPNAEMKVRVCPKCGKQNSESAWHCIDCGTTLSMKTLVDMEDGQPCVVPIAGHRVLSSISPHFEQDVGEILDTALRDDESVVWGCNITQIATTPPFRFGYLLLTSQRLICVQFESEVTRDTVDNGLQLLLNPLRFLMKEIGGLNVRPRRPCLGGSPTVPAVNYPSYPLTPDEKASRSAAAHELEDLVSADLTNNWYGQTLVTNLTAKFQGDRQAAFAFYAPHQAQEAHRLLAARLE